jgi:hypothetical protein
MIDHKKSRIFLEVAFGVIRKLLLSRKIEDSGSAQLLRFVALRLLSRHQTPARHLLGEINAPTQKLRYTQSTSKSFVLGGWSACPLKMGFCAN